MSIIINADDFGMIEDTTDAIVDCYLQGVISSVSLILGCKDSRRASLLAKRHNIPVGLHLNLDEGYPTAKPDRVPSLLDKQGKLNVNSAKLFKFEHDLKDVLNEIFAQINGFEKLDLQVTHMDSHHHIHCHPLILHQLVKYKNSLPKKIRTIRNYDLFNPLKKYGIVKTLYKKIAHNLLYNCFTTTEHFTGIRTYDTKSFEQAVAIMKSPPSGNIELMCHPGNSQDYNFLISNDWKSLLKKRENKLISYRDL